ncbi:hypothetical protein BJ973_008112 [Actinoplanes tereljensis]|nr:hypothetical protein [Actinoplanes tereljensis]
MTGSGVVFAGGSTPGVSGDNQFIGGAVSQVINGATVNSITLQSDATGTQTTSIAVVIAGAAGRTLTITPTGGSLGGSAVQWRCTGNFTETSPYYHASAPVVTVAAGATATITCTPALTGGAGAAGGYYTGITNVGLTVA